MLCESVETKNMSLRGCKPLDIVVVHGVIWQTKGVSFASTAGDANATLNYTLRQEDSYNQTQNTITDHSQCTLTAFLDTYVYVFNVRLTLVTLLI